MALKLHEAKDILRIDDLYNDNIINALIAAIPSYIEATTGMTPEQQDAEPLTHTVGGFLLQLWYNPEGTDAVQLTRTIESLLKTLSVRANQHGK